MRGHIFKKNVISKEHGQDWAIGAKEKSIHKPFQQCKVRMACV